MIDVNDLLRRVLYDGERWLREFRTVSSTAVFDTLNFREAREYLDSLEQDKPTTCAHNWSSGWSRPCPDCRLDRIESVLRDFFSDRIEHPESPPYWEALLKELNDAD